MNVRKTMDVINEIRTFTDPLPYKDDKNSLDPMVRFESGVAMDTFNYHLEELAKIGDEAATPENFKPLLDYFVWRFKLTSDSDGNFFCSRSNANKAFKEAAKVLAPLFGTDVYSLIMPNVKGLDPKRYLHEYILRSGVRKGPNGEDVREVLLVEEGFRMLEKKLAEGEKSGCDLTIDEENLLTGHSELASQYYYALKEKSSDAPKLKQQFFKSLREPDYDVKASYLQSDEPIIKGIIRQKVTKHQFLLMLKRLPYAKWQGFMEKVEDDDLFRCMLGAKNYSDAYQSYKSKGIVSELGDILRNKLDETVRTNDIRMDCWEDKYVRALAFTNVEVYERIRKLSPAYRRWIGEKVGSYIPDYGWMGKVFRSVSEPVSSAKEKTDACIKLKEEILDKSKPLLAFENTPAYADQSAFHGGLLKRLVLFVFAVCKEPNKMAQDILKIKCKEYGIPIKPMRFK